MIATAPLSLEVVTQATERNVEGEVRVQFIVGGGRHRLTHRRVGEIEIAIRP